MIKEPLHLVIDCRMVNMSGIGTYIKEIIPGLIASNKFNITCLGYEELRQFPWFSQVKFVCLRSSILSLKEQLELPLKIPKCDIMWSPNWNVPLLPIRAKRRVVTIHDVYHLANPDGLSKSTIGFVKIMMLFISKFYTTVFTVSKFSSREICRLTPIKEERIAVIPLGVDRLAFSEVPRKSVPTDYILYVGNVKPHKNLLRCLDALDRIRDRKIKLYIVGSYEGFINGEKNIRALIEKHRGRVVFTGRVTDRELKEYYANARLFIFPSLYEGFGLPVLEAMAAGLPIIASNAASIPEVGGNNVMYFDPTSSEDLIEKIDVMLTSQVVADLDAYDRHLKQFDWSVTRDRYRRALIESFGNTLSNTRQP